MHAISYDPAVDGSTCKVSEVHPFIQGDPYASDIDWNEGVSPILNLPLSCSLVADCYAEFEADIDEWALPFLAGGALEPIAADSRRASHSVSTAGGTASLELDMDYGSGAGIDDVQSLSGHAEYSRSDCSSGACPFYLAAFEASNSSEEWEIYLDLQPLVSENKEISNVQIEALQSAMGAWRPATGQVAFPPGSLVLQVDFEVSSDTCVSGCTGLGDGAYSQQLVNPTVVYGSLDSSDGSLEINYSFPIVGGEASLSVDLGVDGSPPAATIGLSGQARCNHADGYELTLSDSASTDPDADIDYVVWYVDGVARTNGYVAPVGTHLIDLLVVDDRGAHDFAGVQTVQVVTAPPCIQ